MTKMIIMGIDSISIGVLDQMIEKGYCPTIKKLIANGAYVPGRSFCPVETGTNWPVLATGASPMITGCNMAQWMPGFPLDKRVRGFPSDLCKAEQIWNSARRGGKRSVIFDYPQSRPVNCEDAIHVGEDGRPGQALRALAENIAWKTHNHRFSTGPLENMWVNKIAARPAEGWANLPSSPSAKAPILEIELPITPNTHCAEIQWVKPWFALLVPDAQGAYGPVAFFAEKDFNAKLGEAAPGGWSDNLEADFETSKGVIRAWTRAKIFEVSPDAQRIHIYCQEIYPVRGFAHPESVEEMLLAELGPYYPHTCRQQSINSGACDVWTFLEEVERTVDWYVGAMKLILGREDWDLFIQKWHPPDFAYHFGAFMIDPAHPLYDPARHDEGWDYWGAVMRQGDRMIEAAMELAGDDVIVGVMSDHGGRTLLPGRPGHADFGKIMEKAGLTVRDADGAIDWSKTKAYAGGEHYVWVNLKGRDPDGCVEPGEEYEEVRQAVINAILSARDEATGRSVVNLACRMEEAAMVGVGGDRAGDVFMWGEEAPDPEPVTREEFERQHPGMEIGTWEWPRHNSGAHKPNPFLIMSGPGFRKGYRKQELAWINAFTPTLCEAWGVPIPKDADGAVLWDCLEKEC